jgi:hypothetical protein
VIEVWHTLRILLEGIVVGAFVLETEGGVEESFISRVAAGNNAKNSTCVVIVRENLCHYLIDEVCHEIKAEFIDLDPISFQAFLASLIGQIDRF